MFTSPLTQTSPALGAPKVQSYSFVAPPAARNGAYAPVTSAQQYRPSTATAASPTAAVASGTKVPDALTKASTKVFNEAIMSKYCGQRVVQVFKEAVRTGAELDQPTKAAVAKGLFTWARENGATSFAHWFFPCRMGSGAVGGTLGAFKADTFIDLVWSSDATIKPFESTFPAERLFCGETDGSSFPNGGLRATHTAAAFTMWDRSSPCFILDNVLRIPCCFVTHYGKCIDLKTPLLRSSDAVSREGIRLLLNMGVQGAKARSAKTVLSYVGWEQEFFVIPADLFKKRPDLMACGRTLVGQLPKRNQQMDLNYFGPMPNKVSTLLDIVEAKMLEIGVPMAVKHNEVAPGQHEMSPIFCVASASCDNNVIFMEICTNEAQKLGLVVLFHEKPFAGINGNGKHNNWSVGTDSGINFFYPGKNDDERLCFVTGIAALAWGLKEYNELVRVSVAHAGNDHRLGAQEAPPAIISLYPGTGFEAHVDNIISGAGLLDYQANKQKADPGCCAAEPIDTNVEDRNRTAPFPFCGNRFEFRAVGSSQNCAFPTTICNTVWAAGAAHISGYLESGMPLRDAVAVTFNECRSVIFTGNGYSAEWPVEAAQRGLPNLNTTPLAIEAFQSPKITEVLTSMGIFGTDECAAFAETMYENYNTTLCVEVDTLLKMISTDFAPAFAKDLATYKDAQFLAGERTSLYPMVLAQADKLKSLMASMPDGLAQEAAFLCDVIKPQMVELRKLVDAAEGLIESSLYPYPTYENLLYTHHF
eukprot:CAMPEP_0197650258 /NCGR_PEP_ID=MMETSP1338-20131121/30828_1 /TAXON_ID=43686 ORGANISM="Pelagodinium beii, Strain RCC1491" /NCGR_SAMPLE_ID=MMETSP1338 /ASSEMBLY_ACC=CAM_ASM_000754 /LENGTH=758 /DNA_ID=CAMNT_0043224621 /DNA_START=55 /DNA_END=2331 /DNA_ORIENTATION=-